MTSTRLAVIDTGQVNERILNKDEYRADFRKVEGASLKRTTHLSSPHAKRMFARCFYSFQASMYFISQLGRAKLDHEVVERIEQNIREAIALCLEVRAERGLPLTVETRQVEVLV